MTSFSKRVAGWATPLVPAFGFAALAARLRQFGAHACRARLQGRCEGRSLCADCQWAEGPRSEHPKHPPA
jgi:hypothetical protein